MTQMAYESDIKYDMRQRGTGGALKLSVANIIGGQMREEWEIQ